MKTKLFEIALPLYANNGFPYEARLAQWEERALEVAGGFSRRPDGEGAWRDPSNGHVYRDAMRPYRIACSDEAFATLTAHAFRLFSDQVAIFTAELGTADIIDRPVTHKHKWETDPKSYGLIDVCACGAERA